MNIDEQAAADAIMSARHSDAFTKEACLKILQDAAVKENTYESRVIELFSSWLDHWSIKVHREPHEVYGAWDKCRELAQKEAPQPQPSKASPVGEHSDGILGKMHEDAELTEALCSLASDQPPSSAKTTDDKQEWTREYSPDSDLYAFKMGTIDITVNLKEGFWIEQLTRILDAHNAELAAERQRREQAERLYAAHVEGFDRDELIKDLRDRLLSALAAIEKHSKEVVALRDQLLSTQSVIGVIKLICENDIERNLRWAIKEKIKSVDLSALREHDEKLTAEVRKPLVDALKWISSECGREAGLRADAAIEEIK